MKSVVNIGSKVPNIIFNKKVLVVNEKTWTEFGSQVSGEKNVMTIFANEDDYWKYMRNPKNKGKKTFKTKNADGSVTFKTIRYMPRYEVVALGSYDENISFRKVVINKAGDKFSYVPCKASAKDVVMSEKNIYVRKNAR